jgi:hypothetical protein
VTTPTCDSGRGPCLRRRHVAGRFALTRLLLAIAAAVAATFATAAAARSAPARLSTPQLARVADAAGPITDSALPQGRQLRLFALGSYWGGPYLTATGETVTVFVSSAYPEDPAIGQRWADFLARLVHGSELSSVTVYLAPPTEVQQICSAQALACYGPRQQLLVAPGEDPAADISAEAVVAHEYGHHVEAHRSNAPWSALDYGTKRWASYEQVCAKARRRALFPGAETLPEYRLNPGEGFAETYRVLNQRRLGLPEAPWAAVSELLYPNARALASAEQDVVRPWQAAAASVRTASLTGARRSRTFAVATPLDGTLRLTLRLPAAARFALSLSSPAGARLARAVGRSSVSVTRTICGQRSVRIGVTRISGAGAFRLRIAAP